MKLLLDTCCLLWALQDPDRLSATVRKALLDPKNSILVSSISLWEISLKTSIGKLRIGGVSPTEIPQWVESQGWELRPLEASVCASYAQLPIIPTHRDPFDRMLVWIAINEHCQLVSRDGLMRDYEPHGLKICW
jgi:PIN domain nuclease of toxin-antitoxin system